MKKREKIKKTEKKISTFFYFSIILFLYIPLFVLFVYSFNITGSSNWGGFSLKWYKMLIFDSSNLWGAFSVSMIVLIFAAFFSIIIGVFSAIGLYKNKFFISKYLKSIIYFPLIIPDIIIGVGLLLLFVMLKLHLNIITVIIGHITLSLAFVIMINLTSLEELDYSIVEAAKDLGATDFQITMKILLPSLIPAIIASILLITTLSIDDFIITFFISGPGSTTLPLEIFSMLRYGPTPVLNALGSIMVVTTFLLIYFTKRYIRKII